MQTGFPLVSFSDTKYVNYNHNRKKLSSLTDYIYNRGLSSHHYRKQFCSIYVIVVLVYIVETKPEKVYIPSQSASNYSV